MTTEPDQTDTTTSFQWNDQTWTVPSDADDWPFEAVEAMEQGKALTFVRLVLGPDQMRKFARGGRTTAGAGSELMTAILDAAGGKTAGE